MAVAVGRAIADGRHLIVQAGTGHRQVARLPGARPSCRGRQVVVATATKALQDQLAGKDLPVPGRAPRPAVRVRGAEGALELRLPPAAARGRRRGDAQVAARGHEEQRPSARARCARLADWAETHRDRRPGRARLRAVGPGVGGGQRRRPRSARARPSCPRGDDCFAEQARAAAAEADVVVVNTHLYGLHLASGGALLPEHDVVVIDEAHQLEDIVSDTVGHRAQRRPLHQPGPHRRAIVADDGPRRPGWRPPATRSADASSPTTAAGSARCPTAIADAVVAARGRVDEALARAARRSRRRPATSAPASSRALKAAGTLIDDLDYVLGLPDSHVAWVEGSADEPRARGGARRRRAECCRASAVGRRCTAVLTSATIPPGLRRAARPAGPATSTRSTSAARSTTRPTPSSTAPRTCPTRGAATYEAARHDELEALIVAAGGRTLALFTSYRAMNAAADALRPRLPLADPHPERPAQAGAGRGASPTTSRRLPVRHDGLLAGHRRARRRRCRSSPSTGCPFPRPDEPLLQARRERARADAFRVVDLPRAATLLAQGAGRLIRTADRPRRRRRARPPAGQRPATAGTSCRPCRRCAAPATAPTPRRSCAS